jgi:hypothetical protein
VNELLSRSFNDETITKAKCLRIPSRHSDLSRQSCFIIPLFLCMPSLFELVQMTIMKCLSHPELSKVSCRFFKASDQKDVIAAAGHKSGSAIQGLLGGFRCPCR